MENVAQQKTYQFEELCLREMGASRRPDLSRVFPGRESDGPITESEVAELAERIFEWAGMSDQVPKATIDRRITTAGGRHYAYHSQHGENPVVLGKHHRGVKTTCHEAAHSILGTLGRPTDHNREFRGLVLRIYDAFLPGFKLDREHAEEIARTLDVSITWHILPQPA